MQNIFNDDERIMFFTSYLTDDKLITVGQLIMSMKLLTGDTARYSMFE